MRVRLELTLPRPGAAPVRTVIEAASTGEALALADAWLAEHRDQT